MHDAAHAGRPRRLEDVAHAFDVGGAEGRPGPPIRGVAGHVMDDLDPLHRALEARAIGDVAFHDAQIRPVGEKAAIARGAHECDDLVAVREEMAAQIAADEAVRAGDQHAVGASKLRMATHDHGVSANRIDRGVNRDRPGGRP